MMPRRQPKDGTRVDSAAEVTAYGNIGPQPQAYRVFKGVAEVLGIFCIRSGWRILRLRWVIEIPILVQLGALFSCHHVMTRRNLKYTFEERTGLMTTELKGVIDRLAIPPSRNSCGEKRLHLRSKIDSVLMKCVEQWLNPKPISSRKDCPIHAVP